MIVNRENRDPCSCPCLAAPVAAPALLPAAAARLGPCGVPPVFR